MNLTEVADDAATLDAIWESVCDHSTHSHPFSWPGWYRALAFSPSALPHEFLIAATSGNPLALVALTHDRVNRRVTLGGAADVIDYCGPAVVEGVARDLAAGLLERARATGARQFSAHRLPDCCGFARVLADAGRRRRLHVDIRPSEATVWMRLPPSWDAYLQHLGKRERHELRRKRRRMEAAVPARRLRTATAQTLDADLEAFVGLHRRQRGAKGMFLRGWRREYFNAIARGLDAHGMLRLDMLEADDHVMATTFGIVADRTYYLYNMAYASEDAPLSPGLYLVSSLIRECIVGEYEYFDFLTGTETYKLRLGGEVHRMFTVTVGTA